MIHQNPKNEIIINWMLVIYLTLNLLNYVVDLPNHFHLPLILIINGIAFISFLYFILIIRNKEVIVFISLMLIAGVTSRLFAGNMEIIEFLLFFRYLGIAFILIYVNLNHRIMTLMMVVALLFFIPVFYSIAGYTVFTKASQNYHSIILMTHNFVFNLAYWKKNERASEVPTILCFFISFFSGGRGPIIAYSLFLIGTFFINNTLVKRQINQLPKAKIHRKVELGLIVLLVLLSYSKYHMYTEEMKYAQNPGLDHTSASSIEANEIITAQNPGLDHTSASSIEANEIITAQRSGDNNLYFGSQGINSSPRINIIKLYFGAAFKDLKQFLFGVPVKSVNYFSRFHFNLHNSYLKLHSKFGMLGSLVMAFFVLRALYMLAIRKNFGAIILILAVLFRIFTDTAAFPGHLDIILYYYFFNLAAPWKTSETYQENQLII